MEVKHSQRQILKSTGIIGGSQMIVVVIGVVRTKVLAVLLGPFGVGVAALYQTTIDLIKSATNFGIGFSAVREVAVANAQNDVQKTRLTVRVLLNWLWFTGLLGAIIALLFCKPLSYYTFKDEEHAWGIALLSITILVSAFSSGFAALLQAFRRIQEMAKANIAGTLASFLASVTVYWFLGLKGIVFSMLLSAVFVLASNWFFYVRVKPVQPLRVNWKETFREGKGMVRLGFFTVVSGFVEVGTMYLVRSFIAHSEGVVAVGEFMAAWTISTIYISMVLTAMSSDYFPRLSAVQHDPAQMNKLINEQTEVALLIAGPVIIGMISFIAAVVQVLYTKDFSHTSVILNWQLIGDLFKILSWAVGFAFLAKGKGNIAMFTNFLWSIIYYAIVYFGWRFWQIEVTGLAFLVAYIIYLAVLLMFANRLFGFRWSKKVMRCLGVYLPLIVVAYLNARFVDQPLQSIGGIAMTVLAFLYSIWHLNKIISVSTIRERIKIRFQK